MKDITISLSEKEAERLIQYFAQELEQAEKRVLELKSMLHQLNTGQTIGVSAMQPAAGQQYIPRLHSENYIVKQGVETEGRPYWTKFVLDTVTAQNRFIMAREITAMALNAFGYPQQEFGKVRMSIAGCLSKLEKVSKVLTSFMPQEGKVRFYGLTEWYDSDGNPKQEFMKKKSEE